MRALLVCLLAAAICGSAAAHQASDSHVWLDLTASPKALRWDIALRDLEHLVGLDADGDGAITWGETKRRAQPIRDYAQDHLAISIGATPCRLAAPRMGEVDAHGSETFAVLRFEVSCAGAAGAVRVRYSALFARDPTHRGFIHLRTSTGEASRVASPSARELVFELGRSPHLDTLGAYWRTGVQHILQGFDHLAFLLSLLLPAVLVRRGAGWERAPALPSVLLDIAGIVTAFTVAHTATLALATLGWLRVPATLAEAAIALSVVLVAACNLFPLVRLGKAHRALLAFGLGLVHGVGFAGFLLEFSVPDAAFWYALFGFNLGVETGQLMVVSLFVPAAYLLRGTTVYRRVIMQGGSALIAAVALVSFFERAFDVSWRAI